MHPHAQIFSTTPTPSPPVFSNIKNNATIISFRRSLKDLCPHFPLPPKYIHVYISRTCALLDPLVSLRKATIVSALRAPNASHLICAPLGSLIRLHRTLRSLPNARLLGTGTHTRSPRPEPQTLLTCSYTPVSILTWLRVKGLKCFQVPKGPRVSRFQEPKSSEVPRAAKISKASKFFVVPKLEGFQKPKSPIGFEGT